MGVIVLEKIRIDELEPVTLKVAPSYTPLHNPIGTPARNDYELIDTTTVNGTAELTVITQNSIAKKIQLNQLVDTILYYHDQQQTNHNELLNVIGNQPGGVPLLDTQYGKISNNQLPYKAANSSVILYGADYTVVTGQEGDFFIDTTSGRMYVWEIGAGGWRLLADLTGPTGNTGEIGAQGPIGPQGEAGIGIDGNRLLSGPSDPSEATGSTGDYYLNTTTYVLFGPRLDDTGAGWTLATQVVLKGTTGDTGATGATGETGAVGPAGADGVDGTDGKTMHYGIGTPSDLIGVDGDFYVDTSVYNIHGPKAAGVWPAGISMLGKIYCQASPPTDPLQGTIWIDTSNL